MSVVDYLLKSLIARLQKVQKAREKAKKKKQRALKKSRLIKKLKSKKRSPKAGKQAKRKKRTPRRTIGRAPQKPSKVKKKKTTLRKKAKRPKAKPKKVKKVKKIIKKVPKANDASEGVCIGEVTHFFSRIHVIVLKMNKGKLLVGDQIRIVGRRTDFVQKVKSLQIESVDVKAARKGQLVGLKVGKKAKPGDRVFKLTA